MAMPPSGAVKKIASTAIVSTYNNTKSSLKIHVNWDLLTILARLISSTLSFLINAASRAIEPTAAYEQKDRAHRHADRQTRQTDMQTDRHADRQTCRQRKDL